MICVISYKTWVGSKPLRIISNTIDGCIRNDDGTRCLVLVGSEKYDVIYNGIRYLISLKGVSHVFSLTIMPKSKFIFIILYP